MTRLQTAPAPATRAARLRQYYERHERVFTLGAFVAGFVFDVLTLPRVDSWPAIVQQALYLVVIGSILVHMLIEPERAPAPPAGWYRRYRTLVVHFLFGSLLNLYTIYYFKSASLLVSYAFLLALVALLAANESRRFKSGGPAVKFALLSLCVLSFSAHVTPVAAGSIGTGVFLLSMAAGAAPLVAVACAAGAAFPARFPALARRMLAPLAIVLAAFLALYLLRVIPPVPLSIPFMGIYHSVQRTAEGYRLEHERERWRFWHEGDQLFLAQPGDRVYVFFRIYSPTRFAERVRVSWHHATAGSGWERTDVMFVDIVGGRAEGFRGYAYKSNYAAGNWRVQVETTDGREIGRIHFRVVPAPAAARRFFIEQQ